jgi:hypothetical protein
MIGYSNSYRWYSEITDQPVKLAIEIQKPRILHLQCGYVCLLDSAEFTRKCKPNLI